MPCEDDDAAVETTCGIVVTLGCSSWAGLEEGPGEGVLGWVRGGLGGSGPRWACMGVRV